MSTLDADRGMAGVVSDALYFWRVRHAARWERLGCADEAEAYAREVAARWCGLYTAAAPPLHGAYTTDMARRETVRRQMCDVLEAGW